MTLELLLRVCAVLGAIVVGAVLLVAYARLVRLRRTRRSATIRRAADGIVTQWSAGHDAAGGAQRLARLLGALPTDDALNALTDLAAGRLTDEQCQELSVALRGAPWVRRVLAGGRSGRWWRRRRAARLLGVIGTREDIPLVLHLIAAPEAEVALPATHAAIRLEEPRVLEAMLDALPTRPVPVQHYQSTSARRWAGVVAPLVRARLERPDAPVQSLVAWSRTAGVLGDVHAVAPLLPLARHPDAGVRTAAVRALGVLYDPRAVPVFLDALEDEDPRVRAAAAHGLGALRVPEAFPLVAPLLEDHVFEVRLAAGLTLARGGEEGRQLLRAARAANEGRAAWTAVYVSGLGEGALDALGAA